MPNHVVVQNLLASDFTDEKVEQIERAIKGAVREAWKDFDPETLSFNFVPDPTVKSDDIPIVIIAELLYDQSLMDPVDGIGIRNRLAESISLGFKKSVRKWRKLGQVKVSVRFLEEGDGYYIG